MSEKKTIHLKIRRYDQNDQPLAEAASLDVYDTIPYQNLKRDLKTLLNISDNEEKAIKIRNNAGALIPYLDMLDDDNEEFYVDVFNIQPAVAPTTNGNSYIGKAYAYAVQQKVSGIEKRIKQAEVKIPHFQWKRQAHMESKINTLGSRIVFLDRRIDELLPTQWKTQIPVAL